MTTFKKHIGINQTNRTRVISTKNMKRVSAQFCQRKKILAWLGNWSSRRGKYELMETVADRVPPSSARTRLLAVGRAINDAGRQAGRRCGV